MFEPDEIPVLRRELDTKVGLPPLTKKLSTMGTYWERENQFSPKEYVSLGH